MDKISILNQKYVFELTSLYCYIIKMNNSYVIPFKIESDWINKNIGPINLVAQNKNLEEDK